MKNISKIFIVLVIFATASCRKDYYGQKPLPPGPVSFSKMIVPILNLNCAKSGCHVAGGQTPNLSPDVAYDNLTGLGYVNPEDTLTPEKSSLYEHLDGTLKLMPTSGKLSSYDMGLIKTWIQQGAQNN
jgi:hypothetical protein